MNIPISEAKAKFAELIRRAEAGEDIVLTRNGKPVAQLGAPHDGLSDAEKRRGSAGKYKDQIWIAPDFDELGAEWDEYLQ